jgi:two-component system, NarL family, response regulator DesR
MSSRSREQTLLGRPPDHEERELSREKSLRVLIAENHRDLSEVMATIIDGEPDMRCVGQVSNADEVVAAARQHDAEVVVLDLMLKGGSGMNLIENLIAEKPGLRIVVFSGLANDELVRETLHRGAAAFVTKGCDLNVLLNELRGGQSAA